MNVPDLDALVDRAWVLPYWLERQIDPRSGTFIPRGVVPVANVTNRNWTAVGTVAATREATVDPRGLLTPWRDGWSLDWWVGADDRWHFPSREAAVRQQLVEGTPVVETAMRLPGGDVVQRVYAVGGDVVAVEITNATPVPVGLALAVRPYNATGAARVERIRVDDRTVRVDGGLALSLPKRAQRVVTATGRDGDAASAVMALDAPGQSSGDVRCSAGLANAALVFPLAHRATLTFAVPLGASGTRRRRGRFRGVRAGPAPSAAAHPLPDSEAAARGWQAQAAARGLQLVLPSGRLADAIDANLHFLRLFGGDAHAALVSGSPSTPTGRDAHGADATRGVDPAATMRLAWAELAAADPHCLERLQWILDAASDTFTWPERVNPATRRGCAGDGHDRLAAAEFLRLVLGLLVREVDGQDTVAICSMLPPGWHGHNIEVHNAPTTLGLVSFAVRWHGSRPALLWEVVTSRPGGPVRVTAPGLDRAWSTMEARGDVLLAADDARGALEEGSFS